MTNKEATNIIIKLRELGLTDDQITDFIVFIETNTPTAEQAEKAKQKK
ncbi:MAG: hypothetical protein IKQ71_02400 [Lachnospiraceae bacterium]|nr:hypothetical protein [Lachnospiraceae bacterium]